MTRPLHPWMCALLLAVPPTGCLLDPGQGSDLSVRDARPEVPVPDSGDRDVPFPEDPGVPPDLSGPDVGPPDAPPPDGPTDRPWTDPNPLDPGPDLLSDATNPCQASPASFATLEVGGFPTEDSPMPPWGQGVLDGDARLESVEETSSGRRWVFRMDAGNAVTVETDLPLDQSPPFRTGDRVHLWARQRVPWWRDLVLVLWDADGVPRFLWHDAADLNEQESWFDCGGSPATRLCPTVRALADGCPAVEDTCGMRFLPPVELLAFGGVASSETPVTFKRGQQGFNPSNRAIFYRVLDAYRIDLSTDPCADYPTEWIRALIRVAPPEALKCDEARIGFSQDNAPGYEFYEICLARGNEAAVEEVKAIDPSLDCGVSGAFAKCDEIGAIGCHGDLSYDPTTRRIDDDTWERLCDLSTRKSVLRMGGGHWVF